jgi:DNA segregation ATPase FtsK/SpoIIIE, S-DNA-T family
MDDGASPTVGMGPEAGKEGNEAMLFHCTLVRGPASPSRQEPVELTVEVDDGGPGSVVQAAVAARFRTGELAVAGLPLSSLVVGTPPLMPGAVLVEGAAVGATAAWPSEDRKPSSALLNLLVHSGPCAGMVIPLARGDWPMGRGSCGMSIPDPDMSREHAVLTVSETEVLLLDSGSSNGTTVDGRKVSKAIISTDSVIRCGASTMTVAFGGAAPSASLQYAGTGPGGPIRLPRRQDPGSRLSMVLTAGLPLLLGVGLAVVTGMWMFLAFTAVSAVAVVVPLTSGRKERKAFKAALRSAVADDRRRRERAAPSAADIVLAVSPDYSGAERSLDRTVVTESTPDAQREHDAQGLAWLRIGTGQQQAQISPEPSDPHFVPPLLDRCPVLLDPSLRSVTVSGPPARVAGLFNFLLMQIAAFPRASSSPVLVHGDAEALPLSARFLPQTMLCSDRSAALETIRASGDRHGYLFLPSPAGDAGLAVREAAAAAGWTVFQQAEGGGPAADIELGTGRALLRTGPRELAFDPDLVLPLTFDQFCRTAALSPGSRPGTAAGLPDNCYLGDLLDWDSHSIHTRWKDAVSASGLPASIGRGHRGTRQLDLTDDGPHLLIAGTTGSGKSELLRTIVAAISLGHSPEQVTFLFVDFKGGSGLGPLARLPHCVGLLTDLGRHGLERALASLRAEVRYREQLLGDAGVQDFISYSRMRGTAAKEGLRATRSLLPRLVIVVDEFRMLIEDFPSALSDLMRIATVGRSLGIHLVMATQRPQGAISSDIRANVTTSISLRVQSDLESHDVIGSSEAAGIPVSRPGRAYFSKGSEGNEIFQAASLSGPARPATPRKVVAHDTIVLLQNPREAADSQQNVAASANNSNPAGATIPIVESIREAWQQLGGAAPRRPVAGELPDKIHLETATPPRRLGRHAGLRPFTAHAGIVDRPEKQSTESLFWHPPGHGHLALLGPPGSGVEAACLSISSQLLTNGPGVHCYILDGDGSFPGAELPGQVGALATLRDPKRGVRIAERVAAELTKRHGQAPAGDPQAPLLLVITAWGAWLSLFRSGPLAWAEDLIHGVVRDGSKAGIHVLITGDRDLSASRLFAALPNRAYFPVGSTEESRMAWPRFSPLTSVPGRAMVSGPMLEEGLAEAQFAEPPPAGVWPYRKTLVPEVPPFRVEPLPQKLTLEETLARFASVAKDESTGRASSPLLLGLGGDELHPVTADLGPGSVLMVLGHRGSGKSGLLAALPLLNPGLPWLESGANAPSGFCTELYKRASSGDIAQGTVVLIDDVDRLGREESAKAAELPGLGLRVVATTAYSTGLLQRVPLAIQARNEGLGILLSPRNITDGEIFGVRVEPGQAVPGRAVLIQHGEVRLFQIPYAGRSLEDAA